VKRSRIVICPGESDRVKCFKQNIARVHGLKVINQKTGRRVSNRKGKKEVK